MAGRPGVSLAYIVAVGFTIVSISLFWVRPALDGSLKVGEDYATFHGAAALVADGRGAYIYDPGVLSERIAEATAASEVQKDNFGHFPFFSLVFVPLAFLPFKAAFFVFTAAGLLVLAAALRRVGVACAPAVVGLVAVSIPGFYTLDLGQMGFYVAALMFGVYLMLGSGRPFAAGLLVGLLAFKFPYAVGIGLLWMLRPVFYRNAIGGAAVSASALVLSGFLVPGAWSEYFSLAAGGNRIDGVANSGFSLFEMLWMALDNDRLATAAWAAITIAVVAVFVRTIRRIDHRLEPSLAIAVVTGLLISPRTGWYDWTLLVVPAVLLWRTYPRLRPQLVVAGAWVYLAGALSFYLANLLEDATGVFVQAAPLVLAAVAGWFVHLLIAEAEASGEAFVGDIREAKSTS